MDRTINKMQNYVQDLRSALEVECSYAEAEAYGTAKEWRSIDRKIRKMEHNIMKFKRKHNRISRTKEDTRQNVKYILTLLLPFLLILVKAVVHIGIVSLAVWIVMGLLDKPFSFSVVLAVWIALEVVGFFVCRKTEH